MRNHLIAMHGNLERREETQMTRKQFLGCIAVGAFLWVVFIKAIAGFFG